MIQGRMVVVQKFGGTSVGSIERIKKVARWAIETQKKGNDVVLVASAMSGDTNRLVDLAHQIHPDPYSLEYDMLVASGEQVSISLLSMAINQIAQEENPSVQEKKARPVLGFQLGILTDTTFSKARIKEIDTRLLKECFKQKIIPVVAGFQGINSDGEITTLGRGGSDTSAVAIAAALKADQCEIYTDVDGVYTTDPRIHPLAKKIDQICYEEMMELASLGAKVLQIRSVELAAKYNIHLHVRSSLTWEEGTWVVPQNQLGAHMEDVTVSGVAAAKDQVKFTLQNVKERPGVGARIFGALSKKNVVVDVIVQDLSSKGTLNISFTVDQPDEVTATEVLETLKASDFPEMTLFKKRDLSKVSIVGVGMQNHPGVASQMFELLAQNEINIELITTSEIKISCLISQSQLNQAVQCLHKGFGLDRTE